MSPIRFWFVLLAVAWLAACGPATPSPTESLDLAPSPALTAAPPTAAQTVTEAVPLPTASPLPETPTVTLPPAPTSLVTLETQAGGALTAFAAEAGRAYLGIGPRLVILDTSDPQNLQVLGRSPLLPGVAQALAVSENWAYWVSREAGLFLLDVSDPSQLEWISTFVLDGTAQSIAIEGSRAVLLTNRCENSTCKGILHVLDLSDPTSIRELGSFPLPDQAVKVALKEDTAYATHFSGLEVVDISQPDAPVSLSSFPSQYLLDAAFDLPYAYLSADGIQIIDLSDPQQPQEASVWRPEFGGINLHPITANAGKLIVFDTFGEFGFCDSTLFWVDVSDPSAPQAVSLEKDAAVYHCAGEAAQVGENLLISDWDGLHLVAMGSSPQLTRQGLFPVGHRVLDLVVAQDRIYWGDGLAEKSLYVLDLSNPEAPQQTGPFAPGWMTGGVVSDTLLIAPAWQAGVKIIDIRQPDSPEVVGEVASEALSGPGMEAIVRGDTLFLTMEGQGLGVIDLSQPEQPALTATFPDVSLTSTRMVEGMAFSGEYAYVTNIDWSQEPARFSLLTLDASNPNALEPVAELELPAPFNNGKLAVSGTMAWIAASYCAEECQSSLFGVAISDPSQPHLISRLDGLGNVNDLGMTDELVFVTQGEQGFSLIDVSDPTSPQLLEQRNTPGLAMGLQVVGDRLYLADGDGGILIYRLTR